MTPGSLRLEYIEAKHPGNAVRTLGRTRPLERVAALKPKENEEYPTILELVERLAACVDSTMRRPVVDYFRSPAALPIDNNGEYIYSSFMI
jgi:hypothetical protein